MNLFERVEKYPPYEYLMQVLLHCPEAAFVYMQIWKDRNKDNNLRIYKEDISKEYLISKTKFKNYLQSLAREALVNIEEFPNAFQIELVSWDEDMFEKTG